MKVDGDVPNRNIEMVVVHWSSKIIPDLCCTGTVDRLPINGQNPRSEMAGPYTGTITEDG